ncbi:MAG TPA: hypothetical protein VGS22_03390 [Thermoanaerobaculia bacterium]|nr:hypothetical protein [Thermoanaerobaculia bacterium]
MALKPCRIAPRATIGLGRPGVWATGAIVLAIALPACAHPAGHTGAEDRKMAQKSVAPLAVSDPGPYALGAEPLSVLVKVSAEARRPLAEAASGSDKILLVIERIEMLRPGATYEVYLDPPEERVADPGDRSYLGQISLFGKVGVTPPSDRSFEVGKWLRARRDLGAALDSFRVLIVPGDERKPGAGAAGPSLRFREISLRRQARSRGSML